MGLLTDVVIADPSDAENICEEFSSDEFTWKETPGLEVRMLVALLAALSNKRISKVMHKEFPLIYGCEEEEGPWAWRISDNLVKLLSRVKNSEIPDLASRWLNKDDEVGLLGLPIRGCLSNVEDNRNRDLASLRFRCSRDEKGRLLDIKEQERRYRAALQVQGLEDLVLVLRDLSKAAVRKTSLLLRISL